MDRNLKYIILNNKDLIYNAEKRGDITIVVETVTGEFYLMIAKNRNHSLIEVYNSNGGILKTFIPEDMIYAFHEIDTSYIEVLDSVEHHMSDIVSKRSISGTVIMLIIVSIVLYSLLR